MGKYKLPEDFKEFIQCLNANNVKYLLVGGWAVGIYGNPRATKDIDFLISKDNKNLYNLDKALAEFGAPPLDINELSVKGNGVRFGQSPLMVEIINDASGIDIENCYARREIISVDSFEISVISKKDLIINKKAAGRLRDLADVEILESSS